MTLFQQARTRLDHRWTPGRMSDYLDGELPRRGRTRLEHHVGECAECRGVLTGLERMLARLHRTPPPEERPDPNELAAKVRSQLG